MFRVQDFVKANLYDSEEAVIQDGLRYLLQARPVLRPELAVYRYQTEDISLGKAANLAGVSFEQMKDHPNQAGPTQLLSPGEHQRDDHGATVLSRGQELQAVRAD